MEGTFWTYGGIANINNYLVDNIRRSGYVCNVSVIKEFS